MTIGIARLKGVLSIDDGAVGRYDGSWAEPPKEAFAIVSADESRIALVAARKDELGEVAPAILGSPQGSVYSVSRDRPARIVAANAGLSDVALRLSDMSGKDDGSPAEPRDGERLDWAAVEAFAELSPAQRAQALLEAVMFPGDGVDPLVAGIGALLARDRTYGLARLMTRRDLKVLAGGAFPPAPEYAGRNGEGGPACPHSYANVGSALSARAIRADFYGRLAAGMSDPHAAARAMGFDEGVLSGGLRPWARHALLAEAILLVRRIVAGTASDPLSIVALAMPFAEARGLPDRGISAHPSVVPWVGALFPEARFPRQFACVGQPPQGGVAIAMAWANSRVEAIPLLAQTGVQIQVVHDVSRMLNLPGDSLCFGCSQASAPTVRPPGQSLH